MLSPDSVRRVRPPKTTIPKTEAADPRSQYATLLLLTSGNLVGEAAWAVLGCFAMVWLNAPSGDEAALGGAVAEEELWRGEDCWMR